MNLALFVEFEPFRREVANHRVDPGDAGDAAAMALQRLIGRLERDDRDRVVLRRAYADWEGMGLAGAPPLLSAAGFRPIYTGGRSRAPALELALDAHEVMLSRADIQRFVFAGIDRDLQPLLRRLREAGRSVTLAGYRDGVVNDLLEANARHVFVPIGQVLAEPEESAVHRPAASPPTVDGPPLVDEDLEATRALFRAARARYGAEVPLVGFYKDFMNPELHHLNNDGRKRLVAELERHGELEVQVRSDSAGLRYAVAVLHDGSRVAVAMVSQESERLIDDALRGSS